MNVMQTTLPTFFVLISFALTACGIHVEVAQPLEPTPVLPSWSAIAYMDTSVVRRQAAPRLTFTDTESVNAQLFMQTDQIEVFALQGHQIWLTVDYDATWFASPQSSAQVRLNVYTRYSPEDPWAIYDNVQTNLVAADIPTNTHDSIGVGISLEDLTPFDVRAEVGVVAYLANGEIVTDTDTNEFHVTVLSDPGSIETDPWTLTPQLGEPTEAPLLLDWRSWTWNGGPCGLVEAAQGDGAAESISAACDAAENGDVYAMMENLWNALENTENLEIIAPIFTYQGLAHFVIGDFDTAAESFASAAEGYRWLDRAWDFSVSLHNLTFTHMLREDEAGAEPVLRQLQELRGQFWDEAGVKLTQANFARFTGESWPIEDTHSYFVEHELPQAQITEQWLAELYQ